MLEKISFVNPEDIEKRSMEIISRELGDERLKQWSDTELPVVKRCIHTSADFDYADNLKFSKDAAKLGIKALKNGASIVTDTNMAKAGINKARLEKYGGSVYCFMSDPDVSAEAKERNITRSAVCMERGAKLGDGMIFAVGNAPTALIRLYELIKEEGLKPALIIGAPVGFVNVAEAKELIMSLDVAYIVPRKRKGGSNIAAAICNALLYQLV